MIKQIGLKIALGLMFLQFTIPLYSQLLPTGVVKGKIIDEENGEGLPFANVFIELEFGEKIGTTTDLEGAYEFKAQVGEHNLQVSYLGYDNHSKTIKVNQGETNEVDFVMTSLQKAPPWGFSAPYPEIGGFWKPVYYEKEGKTIDQSARKDKSGIYLSFSDSKSPGLFGWNDGCNGCGNLYFRHLENGVIELQKEGLVSCTLIGCNTNREMILFIHEMKGKKTKTTISNGGQTLELQLENEKFVFRKIHDNASPEFSTKLFGTWKPVKGKLDGKKIKRFSEEAVVDFDWRKDVPSKMGAIQYKDGGPCGSEGMNLTYRYLDEDFISFQYYHRKTKPKKCQKKFVVGEIFSRLSTYGCQIKFNKSEQVLSFEYDNNLLVLKRM